MGDRFTTSEQLLMDELAHIFERQSMSPLLGRLGGSLLFSANPLSLQQIADTLQISRAAASINLRNLLQLGLVKKLPPGTDRRDYYMIGESFAENLLASSLSDIKKVIGAIDECINSIPHPAMLNSAQVEKHKETVKRLEDFRDVADIYQHSLESVGERIRARQQARQRRRQ